MSVLSCVRTGCTNIMCDRYSHTHGYLCDECFDELVALGTCTDIDDFLNNALVNRCSEKSYEYFDREFPK